LKALIIRGDGWYNHLFEECGFEVITPWRRKDYFREDIDLVLFTGGEDVHPNLYGGIHKGISYVNTSRDDLEIDIFKYYSKKGVKITGICRGFQFINVMSGGRMYQDITNHTSPHTILIPRLKEKYFVTSTHHQLVMLPEDAIPVAWSDVMRSQAYIGPMASPTTAPKYEIESAIFPKYNAFGVQFHPEMMMIRWSRISYDIGFYKNMLYAFINTDIDTFSNNYGNKELYNVAEN